MSVTVRTVMTLVLCNSPSGGVEAVSQAGVVPKVQTASAKGAETGVL